MLSFVIHFHLVVLSTVNSKMEPGQLFHETFNSINGSETNLSWKLKSAIFEEMISKTVNYNFERRYFSILIIASINHLLLDILFRFWKTPLATLTLSEMIQKNYKIDQVKQYIVCGQGTTDILSVVEQLVKLEYDTSGKIIIICTESEHRRCNEQHVFKALATHNIVNVVYFKATPTLGIEVYDYELISPDNCKNDKPRKIYNIYGRCPQDECFKKLFKHRLSNWYHCPLVISTFHQPPLMFLDAPPKISGSDGEILNLISSHFQTDIVIQTPGNKTHVKDYFQCNWTASLQEAHKQRSHASMCGAPLSPSTYQHFTTSYAYDFIDLVWIVKVPDPVNAWLLLLSPIDLISRLLIIIVFITVVSTHYLLRTTAWERIRNVLNMEKSNRSLVFYSWMVFMGLPIVRLSKNVNIRTVILIWILASFIIRCSYSAALMNIIKLRSYEGDIDSIEEVYMNGDQFGGLSDLREYYREEPIIYNNWLNLDIEGMNEALSGIAKGSSNFALAFDRRLIAYHISKLKNRRPIKILPGKIISAPAVIYFPKYSPLKGPVDTMLSRAVESGLIDVYTKIFHTIQLESVLSYVESQRHDKNEPLTFEQMSGPLTLYLVSLLICFLFFLFELVVYNSKKIKVFQRFRFLNSV